MTALIPPDATHVEDFYGIQTYWKIALGILAYGKLMYYGVESGEPFYGWWSWTGTKWQPETYVRSTHFKKLMTES